MKASRRMKRMGRKGTKATTLNLNSLMDVFTNLVFFLLLSQAATDIDEPPKEIKLPDSFVEEKPRPTVNILVSDTEIMVQGMAIASTPEVMTSTEDAIQPVQDKLAEIKASAVGLTEETKERNEEVTILAHRGIQFKVLKKLMASATNAGYTKISLAVNQKSGVAPRE